eukprot:2001881-Prymnesium_polylepis.1
MVPDVAANNLEYSHSLSTDVQVTYASGLQHSDLAGPQFSSWIDVESLISFTSAQPAALQLTVNGHVVGLDNHPSAIGLTASLACASQISASVTRHANMKAAEMDVDFGSLLGLQFSHTPGAGYLDIPVHVRPSRDSVLQAFQVKMGPLDTSLLTSASGASFTDAGTFSGIVSQLDNPSSEVVLSASDAASTVQSQITLGVVQLQVVATGVTLIQGEIASIVVESSIGISTEVQYAPIVAGRGYVSLSGIRRRMLEDGALTPSSPQTLVLVARTGTASCNPCTAQVWGDFNGDCQFLASDVLALSQFVLS